MKFGVRCALMIALFSFSQKADALLVQNNYLEIDTGYRWDKIHSRAELWGADFGGSASTLFNQRINSYQLGAKTLWRFCTHPYVRASGHYAWILAGDFREKADKGNLSGHTWDVNGGLGWLIPLHPCWGFAPVVGWSYDSLNITATSVLAANLGVAGTGRDIMPTDPGIFVTITNINCLSTFQGPWVGVDFLFRPTCCFDLKLGYELHGASWHGKHIFVNGEPGADFGTSAGFSNLRRACPVWGNLFQIEGIYYFCNCWQGGFNFKYQIWHSENTGKYKRTTTPVNPLITHQLIADLEWDSFSLTLQLGRTF